MHYTVKFTGSNTAKESKALAECKSYLGKRIFNNVVKALANDLQQPRSRTQHLRTAHIVLSFVGVRGRFPVRAMVRQASKVTK